MPSELDGRVAVVTGASRGLGRAIADRLAAAGATVALVDLKPHWAQAAAEEIVAAGGQATGHGCDVADRGAIAHLLSEIGRLDILVQNAMWNRYDPIPDIAPDTVDRMLAVGFSALIWGTQAAVPLMAERGGSIINIASVAAQLGIPNGMVYCGVKAGVTGLTRAAAVELGPKRIRVNAISPSTIATEGVRAMLRDDQFAARVARTPLQRLGTTGDIADAALFLASDASSFITGQVLTLDGGLANALL